MPTHFAPHELARDARAALVTAHPGHELCLFGWMKQARPRVFILTDGSGLLDKSRLGLTTALLTHTNASEGSLYGRLSDAQVYRAMLSGDVSFFVAVAAELAAAFASERFDYVACEAIEGYNPTHDICRQITAAALTRANRTSDRHTKGYEFSLIKRGRAHEEAPRAESIWLRLDDAELDKKTSTMRAHPHLKDEVNAGLDGAGMAVLRDHPELAAEVQELVAGMGREAFRIEHLRRIECEVTTTSTQVPFYERYGEMLVQKGRYTQTIRFSEHVVPIVEGLQRFAAGD